MRGRGRGGVVPAGGAGFGDGLGRAGGGLAGPVSAAGPGGLVLRARDWRRLPWVVPALADGRSIGVDEDIGGAAGSEDARSQATATTKMAAARTGLRHRFHRLFMRNRLRRAVAGCQVLRGLGSWPNGCGETR